MALILNIVLLNALTAAVMAVIVWFLGIVPAVQRRPGLRQVLWMLVLLKLVTPPLLEISILPAEAGVEPERASPPLAAPPSRLVRFPALPATDTIEKRSHAEPPKRSHHLNWTMILIAGSGLGSLTTLAVAYKQVYSLRCKLSEAAGQQERLQSIALQSSREMGLSVTPVIYAVSANVSPLLWVRRTGPEIVIPQRLVEQLTDEQLGCVVSHEIAHYLRKDHWTNLFSLFVTALCWWNPIVWWARRELRTAREACCDALVISRSIAPRRIYAETLFQALDFIQAERATLPALTSGFGGKTSTQRRFEMIANPRVNHRLSGWCYAVLLVTLMMVPCFPVRGDSQPSGADQKTDVGTDQNVIPRPPQLWKLQDPSGSDYYLQMKGFEGQFLEVSFQGGGGVIFDTRNLQKIIDAGGYPTTFGSATGGLGSDGFPDWIRAYRFDPEKKEFDGAWYTLSVTDKELGKVVVREVVNADLAAEIRRKASGVPVLLPRDAKVWRLIVDENLQRPSLKKKDAGKKAEEKPKETANVKPPQDTTQSHASDFNGLIDAQWRDQGYGIPRVQDGVLHIDWVQPNGLPPGYPLDWNQANGLPGYPQNQFNRLFPFPQGHSDPLQLPGVQLKAAAQPNLGHQPQSKPAAKPSDRGKESTWTVNSVRTEQNGSELKLTIDCLAGSDMLDGALELWKRFFNDATVERIQIMPRTEPLVLIVIKGHSRERSAQKPGAEKSTEKHDAPENRDKPADGDPPGEPD